MLAVVCWSRREKAFRYLEQMHQLAALAWRQLDPSISICADLLEHLLASPYAPVIRSCGRFRSLHMRFAHLWISLRTNGYSSPGSGAFSSCTSVAELRNSI